MTEHEYVDATNLAKIRLGREALRQMIGLPEAEAKLMVHVQRLLFKIEERCRRAARVTEFPKEPT